MPRGVRGSPISTAVTRTVQLGDPTLDFDLSDEQSRIRESVRAVVAPFGDDYWRELDRDHSYPDEFFQAVLDSGWLSVLIPVEYGGKGLGITEATIVIEEIARSGANATACHAQIYNIGGLLQIGSEELKRKYLPEIAAGRKRYLSFSLTEHESGLNSTAITTRAVRDGDHYVVNGKKNWVSRLAHTDLLLVVARTTPLAESPKKTFGITAFLVEIPEFDQLESMGIIADRVETMMNLETFEVEFRDLRIPAENVVGEVDQGFKYILSSVNGDRICAAAAAVGDARWSIEKAVSFANERVVFDRPIGQNQGIQFPIARAYAQIEAASLMRFQASTLYDANKDCGAAANTAKLLAAEASWNAVNATMSTYGGYAFRSDRHIERKFREARLFINAPGSENLILSHLAQHVLGLPRSF